MTELNYLDITKASDGHIKVPSIGLTSPAITESIAKSALASFADGADGWPLKSLTGYINPVQNLHGQSAPYPAGGGDNKFNIANCLAYAAAFGLSHAIDGEYVRFYGTCSSGGTHGWRFVYVGSAMQTIGSTLSYKAFIVSGTPSITINSITYNSDNTLSINVSGLVTNQAYDFKIGVVGYTGTAPTAWSPYSNICPITGWTGMNVTVSPTLDAQDGTTYPISWQDEAGTVYGGYLDVLSGLLTVDRASMNVSSANSNYYAPSGSLSYLYINKPDKYAPLVGDTEHPLICSMLPYGGVKQYVSQFTDNACFQVPNHNIYLVDSSCTSKNEYLAKYDGAQIIYSLETPTTYQLTPTEVLSILGTNNVWCDTGEIEATYIADTKLYIDSKL